MHPPSGTSCHPGSSPGQALPPPAFAKGFHLRLKASVDESVDKSAGKQGGEAMLRDAEEASRCKRGRR